MKKIILLSHCILNPFSKVRSLEKPELMLPLIEFLVKNDIGIVQLPCPENLIYGQKRWGQVSEQFDTPFYRKTMQAKLESILWELLDYKNNAVTILSYIGIDGSPSCGVNFTCSEPNWGGELSSLTPNHFPFSCDIKKKPGVFAEEISNLFQANNLKIPMLAFNKKQQPALIKSLRGLMEN